MHEREKLNALRKKCTTTFAQFKPSIAVLFAIGDKAEALGDINTRDDAWNADNQIVEILKTHDHICDQSFFMS